MINDMSMFNSMLLRLFLKLLLLFYINYFRSEYVTPSYLNAKKCSSLIHFKCIFIFNVASIMILGLNKNRIRSNNSPSSIIILKKNVLVMLSRISYLRFQV